jgi:radical SAM superfamily enzyme YgiQ (UPF0313 family)
MKVLIVSAWRRRCESDQRARDLPPLTAVHLAALCPPHVEVEVWHEQARPLDPARVDADLVAITAMTGSADHMYWLADALRLRGITVVLGGPHATLMPAEALQHADAVAAGEGELTALAGVRR